jgi:serine/threonine protein kinase
VSPDCAPGCEAPPSYSKIAGYSPLPGYVLLEPLGRGGFGEVWKCEAPGGLHKAVKFVTGDETENGSAGTGVSAQLRQEFAAFQQVKAIRHPFLLSLERVELVDRELVMVMELADRQLGDRFAECRAGGLPGIPRDELLGYLREVAEALDVISAQHGLQHLDVKPANLFLTAGHAQVGDYGLVSRLDAKKGAENRGLTPRYVAPEVLRGQIHTRSDQYSLALVYFELLTGAFPYAAQNVQQMLIQHLSGAPDLRPLPDADRGPVARALAKDPDVRFESCGAFVRALRGVAHDSHGSGRSGPVSAGPNARGSGSNSAPTRGPAGADEPTRRDIASFASILGSAGSGPVVPAERAPAPSGVLLDHIYSVVPVAWLEGRGGACAERPPGHLVSALVSAAEARAGARGALGSVSRAPDGALTCRFLTTIDPRVARVKLDLLWEQGGVTMDARGDGRVVFRQLAPAPAGLFGFGRKPKAPESGLEVVIDLPEPRGGIAEVAAHGRFFGTPSSEFVRSGEKSMVRILDGIRQTLSNVDERRKHPRVPAALPLALYPLHPDGRVEAPIPGRTRDVSGGGLAVLCPTKPPTKYAYAAVDEVPGAAGFAILLQLSRYEWVQDEVFVAGHFRLDLVLEAR